VGRPLSDLTTSLHYSDLHADALETLRIMAFSEKQVESSDQRWFSVRIITGGIIDAFAAINALTVVTPPPPPPPPGPEPEPEPPLTIPAAPTDLSAINNLNSTATLLWKDNASNESGFQLERQKQNKGNKWSTGTLISLAEANLQAYTDNSGVGTFRYRVRSRNAAGDSAWSEWVQVQVTGN